MLRPASEAADCLGPSTKASDPYIHCALMARSDGVGSRGMACACGCGVQSGDRVGTTVMATALEMAQEESGEGLGCATLHSPSFSPIRRRVRAGKANGLCRDVCL